MTEPGPPTAYNISAVAHNALQLAATTWMPLSERVRVADAVVAAVEPLLRAGERAEAMRQLAADLEEEAADIDGLSAPPWAAMYGLKVTSGAKAALILRRAAELALRRAEGRTETSAAAGTSRAPQPRGGGGGKTGSEEKRP
jgi:hypothetical protein